MIQRSQMSSHDSSFHLFDSIVLMTEMKKAKIHRNKRGYRGACSHYMFLVLCVARVISRKKRKSKNNDE
jgi:hypothetical protein